MAKNAQQKTILEKIGFSGNESALYLALLHAGPSSISEIIRKTGLHRPTAYRVIKSLIEKRMVGVMPKGKWKVYVAESPERLEQIFNNMEDDFNSEIHSLHETYEARGKKPVVTFAEGDSAIKEVYGDVIHSLKKNDVYYRYSSAMSLAREKYIPRDYRPLRDKKGLERFIISDEASRKHIKEKLGKRTKFIPADFDLFDLDVSQIIYGNKVALVDFNSKTTIVIENEMIAEFQKRIFKLLYARL
jgi:sugar-specific transcriptional regulator TrmB